MKISKSFEGVNSIYLFYNSAPVSLDVFVYYMSFVYGQIPGKNEGKIALDDIMVSEMLH